MDYDGHLLKKSYAQTEGIIKLKGTTGDISFYKT